ncbi:MAG: transaldolase [SAR202 cluster bacterium]|nr:transaldolase [SAR202 cluster bacterium]
MANSIEKLRQTGQSIWYDNISRKMIATGDLQQLIDNGITGLTSNPTIFQKAIAETSDYDQAISKLDSKTPAEIFEKLGIEDIQQAADMLTPIYEKSGRVDGYASFEVNPHLAHDTGLTVIEGKKLFAELDRPNVMIKVPATPEGMPAITELIGAGVNVNVTLIFSLSAYHQVMDAYIAGLEELDRRGGDVSKIGSVASFFVSRVDTNVDSLLSDEVALGHSSCGELLGKAAIGNAKLAYQAFKLQFAQARFMELQGKGARVQRPLWASTSVKNPNYDDLLYVKSLLGPDTVNTLPEVTVGILMEREIEVKPTIEAGLDLVSRLPESLSEIGISMEEVTGQLLKDGVQAFTDSYDELLESIQTKTASLTEPVTNVPLVPGGG